jgi:hypothetical protein
MAMSTRAVEEPQSPTADQKMLEKLTPAQKAKSEKPSRSCWKAVSEPRRQRIAAEGKRRKKTKIDTSP